MIRYGSSPFRVVENMPVLETSPDVLGHKETEGAGNLLSGYKGNCSQQHLQLKGIACSSKEYGHTRSGIHLGLLGVNANGVEHTCGARTVDGFRVPMVS